MAMRRSSGWSVKRAAGLQDRLRQPGQVRLAALLDQPDRQGRLDADGGAGGPVAIARQQQVDEVGQQPGRDGGRRCGCRHFPVRVIEIILSSVIASSVWRPPSRPMPLLVPEPPPKGRCSSH